MPLCFLFALYFLCSSCFDTPITGISGKGKKEASRYPHFIFVLQIQIIDVIFRYLFSSFFF